MMIDVQPFADSYAMWAAAMESMMQYVVPTGAPVFGQITMVNYCPMRRHSNTNHFWKYTIGDAVINTFH
jgi:hypothetical protein